VTQVTLANYMYSICNSGASIAIIISLDNKKVSKNSIFDHVIYSQDLYTHTGAGLIQKTNFLKSENP